MLILWKAPTMDRNRPPVALDAVGVCISKVPLLIGMADGGHAVYL